VHSNLVTALPRSLRGTPTQGLLITTEVTRSALRCASYQSAIVQPSRIQYWTHDDIKEVHLLHRIVMSYFAGLVK
jgi:hypothetical protein